MSPIRPHSSATTLIPGGKNFKSVVEPAEFNITVYSVSLIYAQR